jgi:hypothetical protein
VPRYYFHIRSASGVLVVDEQGVHLPNLDAAREEALLTAETFNRDAELGGRDYSGSRFEITNADGTETASVPAFVRRLASV